MGWTLTGSYDFQIVEVASVAAPCRPVAMNVHASAVPVTRAQAVANPKRTLQFLLNATGDLSTAKTATTSATAARTHPHPARPSTTRAAHLGAVAFLALLRSCH